MPPTVRRHQVLFPGGLSARFRWSGSGGGPEVFALSEAGGPLHDHGALVSADPERLCRAELRVESPAGSWTVRLASLVYDEPAGLYWDVPGLLIVKYGFRAYGLAGRTGELCWTRATGTPILAVLGSSRLDHVLIQSELETLAVDTTGEVVWRIAHSDVVVEASLAAARLVLRSYDGAQATYDAETGRLLG